MKEIGEELGKFGLVVYNANIKELQDTQGSEYFSLKRQKARANAEKDAKIEVAAAVQKGTVGEKETEALGVHRRNRKSVGCLASVMPSLVLPWRAHSFWRARERGEDRTGVSRL